jgi:hypothetical protein
MVSWAHGWTWLPGRAAWTNCRFVFARGATWTDCWLVLFRWTTWTNRLGCRLRFRSSPVGNCSWWPLCPLICTDCKRLHSVVRNNPDFIVC